MTPYMAALRAGAVGGFLIGMGLGLRLWSPAWPLLSAVTALRSAALGSLIGVAASPLLGWALARRRGPAGAAGGDALPRWRLAVGHVATAVALSPALLWLTAPPDGLLRGGPASARAPGDSRPNIVFITIDALRADHLGAYGGEQGLIPNLDAFAAEASRYDAAYVSSPWTLTSFASIFTSLPPSECGLKLPTPWNRDWYMFAAKLPEEVDLFHEHLRGAGYTTAAELTNCFLTAERGWARGFDHFRNEDGAEVGAMLTRGDTVTENALAWLQLNRREPFFLWAHYLDPHAPYNSPDTPPELREGYPSIWLTRRDYWQEKMVRRDAERKARYQEFCRLMYAEEVRFADRRVGDLLAGIREAGLWDSSLIVISSDHGEELFDHGGFEHGHSLHEEVLRVPLLVKWPRGVAADREVPQVVSMADLPATFFAAAGMVQPAGFRGRPLPRRKSEIGAEVYSEGLLYGAEQGALTTERYKAIWRPATRLSEEQLFVYDRLVDREEQHDVSETEAAASVRERLQEKAKAAKKAAAEADARREHEFTVIDLSDATVSKLQTLGYIDD
jgi:arylsulfatase A-like enzyme